MALEALATSIKNLLPSRGIWTAAQIGAATGKSQPAVSRALSQLAADASQGLLVTGAARSTRYAQVQTIFSRWPGHQHQWIDCAAIRGRGTVRPASQLRLTAMLLSTVCARRFCDQHEMSLQTATGRSLP